MLLALDLGTTTGYAIFGADGSLKLYDSFKLQKDPVRWDLWIDQVYAIARTWGVTRIAYEKVATLGTFKGGEAAMRHGALKAFTEYVGYTLGIEPEPVHISSWKARVGAMGKIEGKPKSWKAYVPKVNELYGLELTQKQHDIAAAIGVGHMAVAQ